MARHPVLQPDGKLAVWGTIVDNFVALDCSEEQAVQVLLSWYNPECVADLHTIVRRCAAGEKVFDWWEDWPRRVADALIMNGPDDKTAKRALQRTTDPMTRRYIEQAVATARAENRADEAQYALADANQRIAELERTAAGYVQQMAALLQRAEAAEAKLAAADWHVLRPIEPETPEPARLLAEAQASISELEAKLAAVPVDSIAYCWLTEVEERDDESWEEHSARVEEWLATQQQEAQPTIRITQVTRPGPLVDRADFPLDDAQEAQP